MPTRNRKRVTRSRVIKRGAESFALNNPASSQGIYPAIASRLIDQLDICYAKWRRVLVVRYDLRQNHSAHNSRMVSRWRKNLADRLARAHGLRDLGYVWVREQERAKKQHYHCALFIDGDLIRHPAKLHSIVSDTWEAQAVGNSVWVPQRAHYLVTDIQSKSEAVYRLSYLAKTRGKGCRPPQSKDYGTSRLCKPINTSRT